MNCPRPRASYCWSVRFSIAAFAPQAGETTERFPIQRATWCQKLQVDSLRITSTGITKTTRPGIRWILPGSQPAGWNLHSRCHGNGI